MSSTGDFATAKVNIGGRIYSTGGVARITGLSQQTVIRECTRGNLKCYRVPGSKFRRITREALVEWATANGLPLKMDEAAGPAAGLAADTASTTTDAATADAATDTAATPTEARA